MHQINPVEGELVCCLRCVIPLGKHVNYDTKRQTNLTAKIIVWERRVKETHRTSQFFTFQMNNLRRSNYWAQKIDKRDRLNSCFIKKSINGSVPTARAL